MDIGELIAGHPFSFGVAALGIVYFLFIECAIKDAPLMEKCCRCGGMWLKSEVFFTGQELLCSECLAAHCEEKTRENYRKA